MLMHSGNNPYYGGTGVAQQPRQQNQAPQFIQAQPVQQSQDNTLGNLMSAYDAYSTFSGEGGLSSMFGGGSSAASTGGTGAATGFQGNGMLTSYGTGATGASGATGGAGGGAGGMAGMGWWALLAAAIVGNEEESRKAGRRDEDSSSRIVDQLSGAVLEQDMDYYGDKIGGVGGEIVSGLGQMGNPEGVWNMVKGIFD